jgi:hypothetical protein
MQASGQDMSRFREQLRLGAIPQAYRALLSYMMDLRGYFARRHPDCTISRLYQGYMDMTYFAVVPPSLKQRRLKVAIVFNYEAFRFEAWLAATNRQVQRQYHALFSSGRWDGDRVTTPATGVDSIVERTLVEDVDFGDSNSLTAQIEAKVFRFINDVERFLADEGNVRRT